VTKATNDLFLLRHLPCVGHAAGYSVKEGLWHQKICTIKEKIGNTTFWAGAATQSIGNRFHREIYTKSRVKSISIQKIETAKLRRIMSFCRSVVVSFKSILALIPRSVKKTIAKSQNAFLQKQFEQEVFVGEENLEFSHSTSLQQTVADLPGNHAIYWRRISATQNYNLSTKSPNVQIIFNRFYVNWTACGLHVKAANLNFHFPCSA